MQWQYGVTTDCPDNPDTHLPLKHQAPAPPALGLPALAALQHCKVSDLASSDGV